MNILAAILDACGQGILWGTMALGVYITFRLLNIADLTVDGSFATGGCVCAVAIVYFHYDPIVAILLATVAGACAGIVTGLLHTVCKIPAILAGILTQIGLYSINLRILGRSNLPLLQNGTVFKNLAQTIDLRSTYIILLIGIVITLIVIGICYWFFGTEIGSAIRATGNNEQMVKAMGIDTRLTKIIGLALSNALIGLSGALVAQSQGYADVKMGIGAIVIALASIVIGEVFVIKKANFFVYLSFIILGSIIYRIIIQVVLQLGLSTDDLKLITALIVGIALSVPVIMSKTNQKNSYKKLNSQLLGGKKID